MKRKRDLLKRVKECPFPLTSAQVKDILENGELEELLQSGRVTRARILNLWVYAESEKRIAEKRMQLRDVSEACIQRDPVIEEFHLVRRIQKVCNDKYDCDDVPTVLIVAQIRELVARGIVKEIRKFPLPNPPRSYFCHETWHPKFQMLLEEITRYLTDTEVMGSDEVENCARRIFGPSINYGEALQAAKESLLHRGLADSPGRVLLRPGRVS